MGALGGDISVISTNPAGIGVYRGNDVLLSVCIDNALSKSKVNIGVFNPAGIRSMLARDDIDLRVFYVSTSPKTRLLRQLNREEYPNVAEIIRRYGTDVEDFKNIDFPCTVVGNENFQEAVFATHDIKWVEDDSN